MKEKRHDAILNIVSSERIRTQEMLRERLTALGLDVTQATLSRDINELGLIKEDDFYKVPERTAAELPQLILDSLLSVDHAGNTVVFKCHSGMAGAACATFDRTERSGVVGTIAGDDTIFILMRTEKEAAAFAALISDIITDQKGEADAK